MPNNLRDLRKEKGLSQKALAGELGLSQNTVSQWENETHEMVGKIVIQLARFFEVTTDYLLGVSHTRITSNNSGVSPEALRIAQLYELASNDEKAAIVLILKKYGDSEGVVEDQKPLVQNKTAI